MRPELTFATGALLVIGAGSFWSLGGLLMRLMEQAGPWQILFYRACALTVFFVVLIGARRILARFRAGDWSIIIAGLCVATAFTGFVFSITHTTVANTFFLLATQPLLTALLAWRLLGETPDRRTWCAMLVALGGVGFMVLDGIDQGSLFGNAMAMVSALGFAGLTVTLRVNRANDMRPGFAFGGVFSALLAGVALSVSGGADFGALADAFRITTWDLTLCIASGTVQIGCGMLLYTLGTRLIGAGEAALFALSEVLLAPVWVWLVINEQPSGYTLTGGVILLTALVIKSWPHRARERALKELSR